MADKNREARAYALGSDAESGALGVQRLIVRALLGSGAEDALEQVTRADVSGGEDVFPSVVDKEDRFFDFYQLTGANTARRPLVLPPPVAPERLERLVQENGTLSASVEVMRVNVSKTGWRVVHREVDDAALSDVQERERRRLTDFMSEVYRGTDLSKLRADLRGDRHRTGNSYLVVEYAVNGDVAFLRRVPAKSMRLVHLDAPVEVSETLWRNGGLIQLNTVRSERRYAQIVGSRKLIYYAEYGASRQLDRYTGEWAPQGETIAPDRRAHEVIHTKDVEDIYTPYGVPRWYPLVPGLLSARQADEGTLGFFQSGGVPPVVVFVSGGVLNEEVVQALNQHFSGAAADKKRGIAVDIPGSGLGDGGERPATIQVERFGSTNSEDDTFEEFKKSVSNAVRSVFRIPPIFYGQSDGYNFATAHAAITVTESQVFRPEREEDDRLLNATVMRELDEQGEFMVESAPMMVPDTSMQLRAAREAMAIPGVTAASVLQTINDAANTDLQIDEDAPSAPAQSGAETPTEGEGPEAGQAPPQASNRQPSGAPAAAPAQREAVDRVSREIARTGRDLEDGDPVAARAYLAAVRAYRALPDDARADVDRMVVPVLYSSPYLSEVALSAVSRGYVECLAAQAERMVGDRA